VEIYENSSGALRGATVSDANGNYWFLGLPPGTYTIVELPQSLTFTTPMPAVFSVPSGGTVLDANVGEAPTGPWSRFLTGVYEQILFRAPDLAGFEYWTKQLTSGTAPSVVASALAHSDEYYANGVVKVVYGDFLGRGVDPASLAFWTAQLHAGLSDQQFEADVLGSNEFFSHVGAAEDKWVDAVYHDLLKRAPDNAGLNYWLGRLNDGQSREQAALALAESTEAEIATIDREYRDFLGRPADAEGVAYWLKQFAEGLQNEDLIADFAGSAEYYKNPML